MPAPRVTIDMRQFVDGNMTAQVFERDEPLRSRVLPAFKESLASILGTDRDVR